MMEYKGYMATVEFDADANLLHGRVVNTRDVITFQGRSVDEIQQAFIDSVEDYLEFCATRQEEPERPFSGKLLLRMSPELHRSVTICAAELGTSVNRWMVLQLEESVARNASLARASSGHYHATALRHRLGAVAACRSHHRSP
ncbi:MAG: type II toxin-antitoxin system HicB family antitoxin [bacterium]|nr:type II toxin-antitoxin system HicB family antitoxin [bacterium]